MCHLSRQFYESLEIEGRLGLRQHFLGHVRFLKQLHLPQEALNRVAHENFERLAGLKPVSPFPWGALRP